MGSIARMARPSRITLYFIFPSFDTYPRHGAHTNRHSCEEAGPSTCPRYAVLPSFRFAYPLRVLSFHAIPFCMFVGFIILAFLKERLQTHMYTHTCIVPTFSIVFFTSAVRGVFSLLCLQIYFEQILQRQALPLIALVECHFEVLWPIHTPFVFFFAHHRQRFELRVLRYYGTSQKCFLSFILGLFREELRCRLRSGYMRLARAQSLRHIRTATPQWPPAPCV